MREPFMQPQQQSFCCFQFMPTRKSQVTRGWDSRTQSPIVLNAMR